MIALNNDCLTEELIVVHPLFDEPEQKRTGENLGHMAMSRGVRFCLLLLRAYLIVMALMLAAHVAMSATMVTHR
ncbi:MAG: hypothetical protein P4L46_09855 [Fimbriimonas sp.]|nr:hypothetical protein [Fimbriimonas sp.]